MDLDRRDSVSSVGEKELGSTKDAAQWGRQARGSSQFQSTGSLRSFIANMMLGEVGNQWHQVNLIRNADVKVHSKPSLRMQAA